MPTKARLILFAMALCVSTTQASAQSFRDRGDYTQDGQYVYYRGKVVTGLKPAGLIVLGHGYAKNGSDVFYRGELLPYVDGSTFRLKSEPWSEGRGDANYMKDNFNVYFNGKKVNGANASTFHQLSDGYAKDAFNAYFYGQKIGSTSGNFRVLGDGYARDSFTAWYMGRKIEGGFTGDFKVVGNGYARDAFNTWYLGKKLK